MRRLGQNPPPRVSMLMTIGLAVLAMMPPAVHADARDEANRQIEFTWIPTSPEIGQMVVFTITGVPAGDIEVAEWEFGGIGCDGRTSFVCTPDVLLCDVAFLRYASAGEKTVMVTVTVGGIQQPPILHTVAVAGTGGCLGFPTGLSWQPAAPEIGEAVFFTVTGHTGDLRTLWDFGEDGCDGFQQYQTCDPTFTDCHEVGFKFASGGAKSVAVVVTDPTTGAVLGSATDSFMVIPSGACDGAASQLYVLQSFHAPGAGGTLFRHEMELYNPEGSSAVLLAEWLPRGVNNSPPAISTVVTVPGQTLMRWSDVLLDLFGLDTAAIGALRFTSLPDAVRVSNLGVNSGPAGTFGWVIPSATPSDGLGESEVGLILHLTESTGLRSNIGCVNMSNATVQVAIDLYAGDGTFLEPVGMSLLPYSDSQINRVFMNHTPVEGYAAISHTQPGATIACVGMVGDNATSDFRSEPMVKTAGSGSTLYLPRAVHDSHSTTDLVVFAPAGAADARVEFLATGQDNSSPSFLVASLLDQEELRFPSIVNSLLMGEGSGALRVSATSGVVELSAVEATRPSGLGMHRSAIIRPVDEQSVAYHAAAIIHLTANGDYRTDVGVVNTTGLTIDVAIDLSDASETRLGTHRRQLLPHSHLQVDDAFAAVGHPVVADGLARVSTSTPGGAFFAYAIVTELNTQDSWEMPASPLPVGIFTDGFESLDTARWSWTIP